MRNSIWFVIAALLLVVWVGSFIVCRVAGFLIHLLLIVAVLAAILHFLTGRRSS